MTTDDITSDGNGDNIAAELERLTAELAQKSADLDRREESLRRMEDDALERDGVLATREAAVGEREVVADADFTQRRVALAAELGQQRDAAQQEMNTWQVARRTQVEEELDALFQRRLSEVTAEVDAQRASLRA